MFQSDADQGLRLASLATALLCTSVLGLIVLFVWLEALPAMQQGVWGFFDASEPWFPLEGKRGMVPMLLGSVLCALGAVAIALPLGIASALFTLYYGHVGLVRPYQWMLALLAGIPSVVFGFWGLTVLVPLIGQYQPPGASLLAGVLILSIMILPTVALTTEAAFRAVPLATLQGAHALGLNKLRIAFQVLIPAARKGLIAGVVLAATRALGETMAVLMVTGNVVELPSSVFDPVRTLTANIALEMAYATGAHRSSLFFSGLVLTLLVIIFAMYAHRQEQAR